MGIFINIILTIRWHFKSVILIMFIKVIYKSIKIL